MTQTLPRRWFKPEQLLRPLTAEERAAAADRREALERLAADAAERYSYGDSDRYADRDL